MFDSKIDNKSPVWLFSILLFSILTAFCVYLINQYFHGVPLSKSDQQNTLRIMTWNIGKIYLKWESRAADKDLEYIASIIKEANPHIVALQELTGPNQLQNLAKLLGGKWESSVPVDQYDRRAGILTRLPTKFISLPTSTGRIAQGAIIGFRPGHDIAIASVHLDAFDSKRRIRQAEEIMTGIGQLGFKETILAGDFNFDPLASAHESLDAQIYRFITKQMIDAAKNQGGTNIVSQRLDYVFYRSPKVKQVFSQVLKDRRINIMDHDPLLVELVY